MRFLTKTFGLSQNIPKINFIRTINTITNNNEDEVQVNKTKINFKKKTTTKKPNPLPGRISNRRATRNRRNRFKPSSS